MSEHLFGKRKLQRHKEYGPIYCVEAQYILTDYMHVTGPIFFKMLALLLVGLIGIIAKRGYIVCKRVKPYVNDVAVIKINGNAPLKRGTGNAKVLKSRLEEIVYHFLFS